MSMDFNFRINRVLIDETVDYPFYTTTSPQLEDDSSYRGFQRKETYRYGIVWFNSKFQASFVNYLGDITMPDFDEYPLTDYISARPTRIGRDPEEYPDSLWANVLQIEFDIGSMDIPKDAIAYQIVMVPRNEDNRSVIDMGLVTQQVSDLHHTNYPALKNWNSRIMEYTSPEILYNRTTIQGEYLEPVANLKHGWVSNKGFEYLTHYLDLYTKARIIVNKFIVDNHSDYMGHRKRIDDFYLHEFINDYDYTFNFKGTNIVNIGMYGGQQVGNSHNYLVQENGGRSTLTASRWYTIKPTHSLLYIDNYFGGGSEPYTHKIILARRTKQGGYGPVQTNRFIPCSEVQKIEDKKIIAYGDTFIKNFEFLRGIFTTEAGKDDDNNKDRSCLNTIIPVETTINLDLISNSTLNSLSSKGEYNSDDGYQFVRGTNTEDYSYRAIQERQGVHALNSPGSNNYVQNFDLYTYNSVYSKMPDVRTYSTKPETLRKDNNIDVRIYASDRKHDMELEDSWMDFKNYLDLDTAYGGLTKLINFKNNLYYFQSKGYGLLSIDQREITQNEAGESIILGKGGILDNYHYLSTEAGSDLYESIVSSERAIYFIDNINKKISRIAENETHNLTDLASMKSWASKLNFNSGLSGFHSYDNSLLFKIDNEDVLVFNEDLQKFISFYTFKPDKIITFDNLLLSTKENSIYLFNGEGYKKGNFENNSNVHKLSYIINPQGRMVNRFDIISFLTYVLDNEGEEINDESFTTLKVSNSFQQTNNIIFSEEAIRRHRVWRLNQFRDNEYEDRIKDSYIKIDVEFENFDDKTIKVDDLMIDYFPTKPH